ncbi:urea amidolyase family protein [Pseudacidovorax intermedius]|uniref:Acetyl-COA carboxylase n=1 Tax=Pseudacidovorax intermedius TaxID=433924 RepID=A0A147HC65_9BURK|nr:urea amidolyase family protein [Pseudacidovorax intermedius]KTT27684.1 acetyl-COA carboxylase [Pseudacidovorax intermedius]
MSLRVLPASARSVLVELDDLAQTLGLLASLQASPIAGVGEIVPGARTLLLEFEPHRLSREALAAELAARPRARREAQAGAVVELPVHYDGEDLAEVAGLLGITPDDVVRRHTGSDWFVAFTGFAPGFAYLSGGDELLQRVPRRSSPRTRIPPGAVAVAGGFSGVYPKASPGGWQILGQTPVPMWDLDRDPPALLQPGQRVRFVDAGARPVEGSGALQRDARPSSSMSGEDAGGPPRAALTVVQPGLQALLQDLGRPGQAGQGVSASGAMDRRALRGANRLVGNAADAACIEVAQGGVVLQSRGDTVVAVTGAAGPLTLVAPDGRRWAVPRQAPVALGDGDRLHLGEPEAGVRSYVALRGGIDRAPVLGSLAFDTLAQVGPPPLAAGDLLPVRSAAGLKAVGDAELHSTALPRSGECVTLDIQLGPRTDWFTPEAMALLAAQEWTVTPQSNRVGLRIQGAEPLTRAVTAELPSEGTALGAIQVPASGQPVLFLADHPLTGGYPVIGCIAPWHLDLAGQIPVGTRIRFHVVAGFTPIEFRD